MENNAFIYHPAAAAARASIPADRAADVDEVMDAEGHSFISADPRSPNTIEMTTGLVVRTEPGWMSVVRSVATWAAPRPYLVLDGAIETDWYRTDIPVTIRLGTLVGGVLARWGTSVPYLLVGAVVTAVAAGAVLRERRRPALGGASLAAAVVNA